MHTQNRGHRDDRSFANQNPGGWQKQFQGNRNPQMGQGGRFQSSGHFTGGRNYMNPDRMHPNQMNPDRGAYGWERGNDRNLPDRGNYGWERGSYGAESERFATGRDLCGQQMEGGDRNRQRTGNFGLGSHPQGNPFVGKGPKGYVRSDERIREEICERLSEGYLDASEIEVVVREGEVTLTGMVTDRQTKRLAEEIADAAHGVKDIENRLKVKAEGMGRGDKIELQHQDQKSEGQPGNFNPGQREQTTSSSKRSFV